MTEDSLAQLIANATPVGDGFSVEVTPNWTQGRTSFGGLTSALLLEVARREVPDLPPLRSALIDFTGPVTEPATYSAEILRQGRTIITIEARAKSRDQVVGPGRFPFGHARESGISVPCPAPDAPAPADTPDLIPPPARSIAPGFHTNFDLRLIEGGLPGMGATRGYLRGWARHKDPESRIGEVAQLCLGDILPPAVFPLFPRLGPNSSMKWIFNVVDPDFSTEDGWYQVESEVTAAADGYSSQTMRMWSMDGRLIADGMQSVIVFV
ncbi:MAG: thioesterase family protein [Paracoccaceae bacterium]